MLVTFHSQVFDMQGFVTLKANGNSTFASYQRRVSRTATLDGNSSLSDMGFSLADNTLVLKFSDITVEQVEILKHLISSYARILFTDETGSYEGAIESVDWVKKPVTVRFLVAKEI